MLTRIRISYRGKKKNPVFKVVVIDQKKKREGKPLEYVGTYWPNSPKHTILNFPLIDKWLSRGAKPSSRVIAIIKQYKKSQET